MAIAPSIRIDIRGSGRKPISSTNTLCSLPHHNCNFYQGHTSIIRIESIAKTTHQSTRRARDNQHFKTMNTSTVPTIIYANYANCQPRHLPTMPTMPSANNATANHAIYANCQPRHICQPRQLPTTPSANNATANHAIYANYQPRHLCQLPTTPSMPTTPTDNHAIYLMPTASNANHAIYANCQPRHLPTMPTTPFLTVSTMERITSKGVYSRNSADGKEW